MNSVIRGVLLDHDGSLEYLNGSGSSSHENEPAWCEPQPMSQGIRSGPRFRYVSMKASTSADTSLNRILRFHAVATMGASSSLLGETITCDCQADISEESSLPSSGLAMSYQRTTVPCSKPCTARSFSKGDE